MGLILEAALSYKGNKSFRLLNIYERLNKGELLNKTLLSDSFGVTPKTIQRDIDDLRTYLAENHAFEDEIAIKYDKSRNAYYLVRLERDWFTNEEVLALCKILLESRAFQKEELDSLITKLIMQAVPNDRQHITRIINSEHINYIPLQHGKGLLTPIWELSQFIVKREIIAFKYKRQDGIIKDQLVKPVSLLFSEFYFYLIAFFVESSKKHPAVFRVDRITDIKATKEKFNIPYKDRFNEGEFRKRVQFMYPGELKKVTFEFSGNSVEAILDRLPTAEIVKEEKGIYTITAEMYGEGIDMWLGSQGSKVRIIK